MVKKSAVKTAEKQQKKVPGRPFKPGESGNPAGRPKGSLNFATKWWKFIDIIAVKNQITAEEVEQQLLKVGFERASEGDHKFWGDILDRVYGKPRQTVEVEGRIDTREQRVPTEAEVKAANAYLKVLKEEINGNTRGRKKG